MDRSPSSEDNSSLARKFTHLWNRSFITLFTEPY